MPLDALAPPVGDEGDDGGNAAEGRAEGEGLDAVSIDGVVVGVHDAGHDVEAGGVNDAAGVGVAVLTVVGLDPAVADDDVLAGDSGSADDQAAPG